MHLFFIIFQWLLMIEVLALPGFLQVTLKDMRYVEKINSGGAGNIFKVQILDSSLRTSMEKDEVAVAKVPSKR